MKETLEIVLSMYEKYVGESWHMLLLAAAVLYLVFTIKRQKIHQVFVLTCIVFGFIFLCPVTAKIIMKYCIGKSVYWRMMWVLPSVLMIAYVGASALSQIKKRKLRPVFLLMLMIVIGVSGKSLYFNQHYVQAANLYKLPYPTVEICDVIAKDAAKHQISQVKVTVPNPLVCYIRQYNAAFSMPYGRNALKLEDLTQNQEGLLAQMNSKNPQPEILDYHLRTEGCNYFVWNRQDNIRTELEKYGFVPVGDFGEYRVFRLESDEE